MLYVFGVFLMLHRIQDAAPEEKEEHPENNAVVRWIRKLFPVTHEYHGQHFMVRAGSEGSREATEPGMPAKPDPVVDSAVSGRLLITPLAVALVLVEVTDLIFAVDSIPAVFAITADPFLVFTSNVFADPRPALPVFRAGRINHQVPLSQARAIPDIDPRRGQNAGRQVVEGMAGRFLQPIGAGRHRSHPDYRSAHLTASGIEFGKGTPPRALTPGPLFQWPGS